MKELLVATKNKGKLREIREALKDFDIKITSLADYSGLPDIVEDGKTFRSNAVKKAMVIAAHTKALVLGEDSGLEVKAIGNRPGVYSSRFAGEHADDIKNNLKLLCMLNGVPMNKRHARYRCVAALACANNLVGVVSGSCSGLISPRPKGKNGFGYDPLFFIPKYKKTFGELDPSIKAKMSHRSRALQKVKEVLREYWGNSHLNISSKIP